MKKILSMLIVAIMMFSFCTIGAFAATEIKLSLVASKVDDKIVVTVSSDTDLMTLKMAIGYDSSLLTYDGNNAIVLGDNAGISAAGDCKEDSSASYFTYGVKQEVAAAEGGSYLKENIMEIYFTPVNGTTITEADAPFYLASSLTTMPWKANGGAAATSLVGTASKTFKPNDANYILTVTPDYSAIVTAGSTDIIVDDEDFSSATEDNYTSKDVTSGNVKVGENTPIAMGEGGKIYTYFNKTATTLEAGKYGIDATINGKKFRFPGKVDVTIASGETEAKWAIKLVIPTGKFSDNVAASVTDIADYYITD